jgi:cytochrome P450
MYCNPLQSYLTQWLSIETRRGRGLFSKLKKFCNQVLDHLITLETSGLIKSHAAAQAYLDLFRKFGLSRDEVLEEILLIFTAGHQSTTHSLSWFVYALAKYPDIQRKAQAEVACAYIEELDSGTPRKESKYPTQYIECVLQESMRKYTVTSHAVLRYVSEKEGLQLGKYSLPQGIWVYVPLYVLHNTTANWGPTAANFDPDRFNSKSCSYQVGCAGSSGAIGGYTGDVGDMIFAPFSHGARSCLGMNLALMQVHILLRIFKLLYMCR